MDLHFTLHLHSDGGTDASCGPCGLLCARLSGFSVWPFRFVLLVGLWVFIRPLRGLLILGIVALSLWSILCPSARWLAESGPLVTYCSMTDSCDVTLSLDRDYK